MSSPTPPTSGQWPQQLVDLITALGQRWGIEAFALDQAGRAALAFEGKVPLQLDVACQGMPVQLQLRVELGGLPARVDTELLLELIRLNRLGSQGDDCCVMLADDGASVWWLQNVPWRGLDADGFVQTVDRFLAVAQDLAPGFDPIADRADDGEPARRMPPELGLRG